MAQPPGGSSGGICEGRVTLPVGERSLNTAIVSYLNYGSRQPRGVVTITVAHEFGHNFGSSVSIIIFIFIFVIFCSMIQRMFSAHLVVVTVTI